MELNGFEGHVSNRSLQGHSGKAAQQQALPWPLPTPLVLLSLFFSNATRCFCKFENVDNDMSVDGYEFLIV